MKRCPMCDSLISRKREIPELNLSTANILALYHTVNEVMLVLGMHGEIQRHDDRVSAVMYALHDIDGGLYVNLATHNIKPITELQIRSAVYGCTADKCVCGRCDSIGKTWSDK